MRGILLIAGRELRSFFTTWMGYIIVAAGLLITGLFFNSFAMGDQPRLSADIIYDFFYTFSGIAMVASIFLGMRLLSEERSQGTLVIFFTSPLTERQLIWGKFLSVVTFFALMQLLSLYMPFLIMIEGKVAFGHLVAGYLGVTLLGTAVLAITIFASVISPNQLVSAILGASITVIFLVLWLMAGVVDAPFKELFSYLAIHNMHFRGFSRGLIHTEHIIYYLSVTMFFLECAVRALESRRAEG